VQIHQPGHRLFLTGCLVTQPTLREVRDQGKILTFALANDSDQAHKWGVLKPLSTKETQMVATTQIQNVIAVDSADGAGAVTWWRCSDVDHTALCEKLTALGVDAKHHPVMVDDAQLLTRGLNHLATHGNLRSGGKLKVIPLGDTSCYSLERTTVVNRDVHHTTVLKVLLKDGSLHCWEDETGAAEQLAASVDKFRGVLDGYDVGMWLAGVVLPSMNALTLRDRGGVYYVPPTTIARYREIAGALADLSKCRIFEMPAMECEQACAAILDAVQREAEKAARKMEDELIDGDLSPRALKNRTRDIDKVLSKVASYEAMLGASLTTLHERFELLSAQVAAAILTASAPEAEAA